MTDDEFNELPAETRARIIQLEALIRELMLDIGPLRAADLLKTISGNLHSVKFVSS
jgi:two-component sensor histidine kinase